MLYEQYGSLYKIKNNTSRSIFEDVVKAYHAGAYRSAIGSLWTLLVFDITIKINNNSIAGDKKSKEKLDKFEAAVNKLKIIINIMTYLTGRIQLYHMLMKHVELLMKLRRMS